ncbi:hypothetical protein [Rhizobium lentis]|uniref:hypothetical protein n=1 Tax=Rhizobium lentis TaxID=1138194 RepID=UPI001C83CFC3|nr:hypothetical protein [Rhizobium lentis]MBX5014954.1 hypothetical protein [Rhizobium lentis]
MDIRITREMPRLRKLITDLERLEAGHGSAPALMSVPVLDQWSRAQRQVNCLEGDVAGHLYFPDGRIVTSEIYAHLHDDDEHFVRTLDGWFRLGVEKKGERL